jgi:large subunit ribosomal protein L3
MADAARRVTKTGKKIRKSILGRKVGMTQIFDENGNWVPITLVEAGPCTVIQVKTVEKDGYSAVQVGFGPTTKKPAKPQEGLYAKLGIEPQKFIKEIPFIEPADLIATEGTAKPAAGEGEGGEKAADEGAEPKGADQKGPEQKEEQGAVKPGDKLGVHAFSTVKRVDVRGISKGRGFQGVIRRHHFNAGPKSRGTKNIREPGSTGMHTDPGRVLKGKKMPGHLGAKPVKARNVKVVRVEPESNLLLLRGSVPGPNGGYLFIEESLKQK